MKRIRLFLAVACLLTFLGPATAAHAAVGWGGLVYPNHGANIVSSSSVTVYCQVWKLGVTDSPGQGADITAEVRYTTDIAATQTVAMTYNTDIGANDEYAGVIPQAALVGASYVVVNVVFTDVTDNTTYDATGDQLGNPAPQRYNVVATLPNDVEVTFTLCMSGTPTAGPPCVIGSAVQIGTWGAGVPMTNIGGELWQVAVVFPAGSNPNFEYKFKRDGCADWEGGGNRVVSLPTDGTTAVVRPTDSYNGAPNTCVTLLRDKVVCFQVCMAGVADPPVCVIGNISQLTGWTTGVSMTQIGAGLYQACITFLAGSAGSTPVEYKFKKDDCNTWESVGNRTFTVDNSSPDDQTLTSTWDDGPSICGPTTARRATWGQIKVIYR